ncbi:unnamed protein product [Lasius platythorax]|uniref:RNase H type-1 domain-containing protein n=1 Tax=Lasius platythorax TaxID=488582 RepID=A0AAV2NXA7_9HYME
MYKAEVAGRNKVVLVWVPGHFSIRGNKAVDQLAKARSEAELVGPVVDVSCCLGREMIDCWLWDQHLAS